MHKKMPATTWLAWVHVFNYFTCLLDRGASFSGAYWCLIVTIYLGWSFWTNNWKFTWIIWPVAGVLYAAVLGMVKMTIEGRKK